MVPASIATRNPHSIRSLVVLLQLAAQHARQHLFPSSNGPHPFLFKRGEAVGVPNKKIFVVFAALIPVLVLLSGVFAGLTLGYMSLDMTQLTVLSMSGTPLQRKYAAKIKPVRQNGHLLLVTLLLANMIVNESLPLIATPVLKGGVQSVIVSTVLIVIFAEIIPQSLFTRHGLYLGAKMAFPTMCLLYTLGILAWPVAKLLEWTLGPHHGIIYRRAELKELIAMHSNVGHHGGDLKTDTVTIIGATLDLQEKVVKQAMTPIEDVFMLSINAKLDYETLTKICKTGHSRVPVYEEVELPIGAAGVEGPGNKCKKIVGILLVKQCVLLDPKDAVPVRTIPLNHVPYVPSDEPLLGILDRFQEGRSHMAIVSRFSVEKAASVKQVVKRGLTQRLKDRVGMGDSSSDEEADRVGKHGRRATEDGESEGTEDIRADGSQGDRENDQDADHKPQKRVTFRGRGRSKRRRARRVAGDLEAGIAPTDETKDKQSKEKEEAEAKSRLTGFVTGHGLEQYMPADAVLAKEGAEEFLRVWHPAIEPLGIITLEDVLEELIGEEIYDEFDQQGAHLEMSSYIAPDPVSTNHANETPTDSAAVASAKLRITSTAQRGLSFLRSKSAPPIPDVASSAEHHVGADGSKSAGGTPTTSSAPPPTGNHSAESQDEPQTPSTAVGSDTMTILAPCPVLPHSDVPVVAPTTLHHPTLVEGIFKSGVASAIPAISRSASPAPSLEAILLDRKRRLNAGNAATAAGTSASAVGGNLLAAPLTLPGVASSRNPSIKGKFKSRALRGGESAGIVVAEQVKGGLPGDGTGGLAASKSDDDVGSERILSLKDKEGPDKELV